MKKTLILTLLFLHVLSAHVTTVRLEGVVDMGMKHLVQRALQETTSADTLILHITTDGGRIDAALEIADMLFTSIAYSIAYIEDRALSAGALISIACKEIAMQKGSIMGDSAPVTAGEDGPTILGEKIQSPLRAKFRLYAHAHNYHPALAEAMVTPELTIFRVEDTSGIQYMREDEHGERGKKRTIFVREGELLTLSDTEALAVNFSKGSYTSLHEFTTHRSLAPKTTIQRSWSEHFVSFIGTIAPFLLMIGMASLYIESRSPGVGVPGLVGTICLTLVFTGQYMAGLAAHTELLILGIGLLLLMVEIFILPGFGIAGIAGILCIAVAGLLSLQNFVFPSPDAPWQQEFFMENLTSTTASFLGALALIAIILMLLFPKMNKLVPGAILEEEIKDDETITSSKKQLASLNGKRGIVIKPLFPTGVIEVEGVHYDATSKGYALDAYAEVTVIGAEGAYLVVSPQRQESRL